MADKKINLHFYQLNPEHESPDPEEKKQSILKIQNVFSNITLPLKPIQLADSRINLYGEIENKSGLILGTLIKNQINDIPPSYDESASVLAKLPLTPGQGLAYQTSFLYDPSVRILMIESVRNGVGVGTFCSFLNRNFELGAIASLVINPSRLAEFSGMTTIKKFQVKIAKLEQGTIFNTSKKTSVGQIIRSSDETNTDTLEYILTVRKHDKSLSLAKIRTLIRSFLKYEDTSELKKLIVTGSDDEDSGSSTIDFIEQKLVDSITVKTERLIESFEIKEHYAKLLEVYKIHKSSLNIYKIKGY